MQLKRIWITTGIRKDGQVCSENIFAKPQEVYKKSKFGNSDSSNNSLVCHKEMLVNDILQAVAHSGLKDK